MIESYKLGHIVINGKEYKSDLIIYPNHVKDSWWRKRGHELTLEDIEEIIKIKPKCLVVGTGLFGMLKIKRDVWEYLQKIGIEFIPLKTEEAIMIYNKLLNEKKRVVAALHLTC